MPPKAASAKKKKAVKSLPDEEPLSLEEQNLFLTRQVEALKLSLIKETSKSSLSELVVRDLRAKLQALQQEYDAAEARTLSISTDMARQYKSMREELLKKINQLENEKLQLKDELRMERERVIEVERKGREEVKIREGELKEQKQKMDEMAYEFGQMLKTTLDKMSEKIEITNQWENVERIDTQTTSSSSRGKEHAIVRTFEDFHLGSS